MHPLFETEAYKNTSIEQRYSMTALCKCTGIPKKYIKQAKEIGLPGFMANQTINWAKLKPEFEKRIDEITGELPTDIKTLKEELAKREIRIKDLTIKKMEGGLIAPEEIKQYLVELATKLSVVINKELSELPPRLAGKAEPDIKVEIDKAIQSIFIIMQSSQDGINKLESN